MKLQGGILTNKNNYGVEILNKSIREKENYYTKLLNTLHDVTIHLGYQPDTQFYGALQFAKAKDEDDIEEITHLVDFEENRVKAYSEYLCDVIYKDLDRVSDTDLVNLVVFQKEHPGTDEYFDNIVYKSKECLECQDEDVEENKPKVVKDTLGRYLKDDE